MTANPHIHSPFQEIQSLHRHLTVLATLPENDAPLLSVYLDLRQPMDGLKSKFKLWKYAARITVPAAKRAAFDAAAADLQMVFQQKWREDIRSVAAFSRVGEEAILLAMPFSATLETQFSVGETPTIFPLVQLKDRFHRFVVVISTEESSRIFEITLGAISAEILATRPEVSHRIGREWTQEHYHQKKKENERRFLKDQVEIIGGLMSKRGLNHLILAGHPRFVSALRGALPKELESLVSDTIPHAPNGQDYSALLEQAIEAFIEVEQNESHSTVERMHGQVSRGGLAVVGVESARDAMECGAASELVISEELPDSVREDLVRMATKLELPIEVCEGDELLNSHGGVGCLLRYPMKYAKV
jgi:ribosomal protein L30E